MTFANQRRNKAESGNIFTFLFGAVAVVGVITAVTMQLVAGPIRTASRVNAKNMAEAQMLGAAKILIIDAVTQTNDGDIDTDGYIEPREYTTNVTGIVGGGSIPLTVGATRTDPWGTLYGYCVWDAGPVDNGKNDAGTGANNRLNGANTQTDTILAVVSPGPDKVFQTNCKAFDGAGGDDGVNIVAGSDDIVQKYSYAEARSSSSELWAIKVGTPNTANIGKSLEIYDPANANTVTATINRQTGIGDFLGVTTDVITAKTASDVQFVGNVAMGTATSSTYPLYMTDLMNGTSGNDYSLYVSAASTPTGASTANNYAGYFINNYTPSVTGATNGALYSYGRATHASGTLSWLYGSYNRAGNEGGGTTSTLYGAYNMGQNSSGTATNIYGSTSIADSLGGTSTNMYGAYNYGTSRGNSGTISNLYGAYNYGQTGNNGQGVTNMYGSYNYILNQIASGSTSAAAASYSVATHSGGNTITDLYGDAGLAAAAGPATTVYGVYGRATTSAAVTTAYGGYAQANKTAGSLTNQYGQYSEARNNGSDSNTLQNMYGSYSLGSLTSTTSPVTNLYGAYNYGSMPTSGGTATTLYGAYNYGLVAPGAIATTMYGARNEAINQSTAGPTTILGAWNEGRSNAAAAATSVFGAYNLGYQNNASGSSTDTYGSYSQGQASGTTANLYGAYNYGLQLAGSTVSNTLFGAFNYARSNITAGTLANMYGARNYAYYAAGGGTISSHIGSSSEAYMTGATSTATAMMGALNFANKVNGTTTNIYGAQNAATLTAGTTTSAAASYNNMRAVGGTGTNLFADSNYLRVDAAASGSYTNATGVFTNIAMYGTSPTTIGFDLDLSNEGTGTMATVYGLNSYVWNHVSGGTMTNAYGVRSRFGGVAGTTIGSAYAYYADLSNSGTTNNYYGLYVADEGAVATYYAVYTAGTTKSYFGGNIGIGSGKTAPAYSIDTAGDIRAASVIYSSDARLKKNVKTIDNALDSVMRMRGVSYEWKDQNSGKGRQIGLIAQEVEKIYPELVKTDAEGIKSVNYAALVGPLIESVKTLKAENDNLSARIEALETKTPVMGHATQGVATYLIMVAAMAGGLVSALVCAFILRRR